MLIYLWIPQSPAQTDAIIRESSAILLFFGVVETKKFEASQMVLAVSIARAFQTPVGRASQPAIPPGDWNVARTRWLETCATFGFKESLDLQGWTRIGAMNRKGAAASASAS